MLTIEDFANRCLRIAGGDMSLVTPCCGNCKSYKQGKDGRWRCIHPKIKSNGKIAYLEVKPDEFCSRFENNKM